MKTCTSISGGQSSAYIAANYPTDYNVFALVTVLDNNCAPKDKGLIKIVSDKIGKDFIGTVEDDTIIHTILDLEQEIGNKIHWVTGKPFDNVLRKNGLPNIVWRYCTTNLKIEPMYNWWKAKFDEPILMNIGFRAGEDKRAKNMLERCNEDGLRAYGKTYWQKPNFPMIEDNIHRDNVVEYWKKKSVRFAKQNNCVGCFHRNPLVLRKMYDLHPNKMKWFEDKENERSKAQWKKEMTYSEIKAHKLQHEINFDDWSCDTGYCGL
tara:strand:- start:36 stop:827 length:792 start_codon:yes stop_codon:yes gene_type:complete